MTKYMCIFLGLLLFACNDNSIKENSQLPIKRNVPYKSIYKFNDSMVINIKHRNSIDFLDKLVDTLCFRFNEMKITPDNLKKIENNVSINVYSDTLNTSNLSFSIYNNGYGFDFFGIVNELYVFYSNSNLLILDISNRKNYMIGFSPHLLRKNSKPKSIFKLDSKLMPISALKKNDREDIWRYEYYPYTDLNNNFTIFKYPQKKNINSFKNISDIFDAFPLNSKYDTICFANGGMFHTEPIWSDPIGNSEW